MFYNYILDHAKDGLYTSIKPTHHITKYYQELRQLNLDDVINLDTPTKKVYLNDSNKFIFTPAVWKIVDMEALKLKASEEEVKPYFKFQKGKLMSYLNRYNAMPWTNQWTRMKFDKGRCNGEVAWKTTEKEENFKNKQDRFAMNDLLFGDSNWLHYDVPSSIPQVIYLINNKKWFGKRVWDITGEKVKSLGQRIMFNTTDFGLARSLFQYYKGNKKCSPSKTKLWGEYQNGMWVESEYNEYETFIEEAVRAKKRLTDVIGPLPGKTKEERNQLFIHESNIYLMVLNKFIDAGAKVYEVYDSFYWNKDSGITAETVADWCKDCGEYYINHYEELMAQEELIFNESTIQQRLEKKERIKAKPSTKNKPSAKNKVWKRKVRLWLQRHNNEFNPKWTEEERNYAEKLQSR